MNELKQLDKAILIATQAHYNQTDKSGNPYILHPLHIMSQLLYDKQLATIGVLHDVIEDSDMSIDKLKEYGFSPRVLSALTLLTHLDTSSYEEYIESICSNSDAVIVKRKDLEHNSNITRLKGVTDRDIVRMTKYHNAYIKLGYVKNSNRYKKYASGD